MALMLEVCETSEDPRGVHLELFDGGERVGALSLFSVGDAEFMFELECTSAWVEAYLWDSWLALP